LQSFHKHDYKSHLDKNGSIYMVDGGLEYLRRTVNDDPFTEASIYNDAPHNLIRCTFHWGTRGKNGNQPLEWKQLEKLDTDHIQAIIDTQSHIPEYIMDLFKQELEWRNK